MLALLGSTLLLNAFAAVARADGDPASDYLVARPVFLPSDQTSVSPAARQPLSMVQSANRAGFAIRVAVISSQYDLGSITALWRKPAIYARFLGLELSGAYKQRLLVVMPNGFGFNWPGHAPPPADHLLNEIPTPAGDTALLHAAGMAVRRLAAANGIRLTVPAASRASSTPTAVSRGRDRFAILLGGAVAALAAASVLLFLRQRRIRRIDAPASPVSAHPARRIPPRLAALPGRPRANAAPTHLRTG